MESYVKPGGKETRNVLELKKSVLGLLLLKFVGLVNLVLDAGAVLVPGLEQVLQTVEVVKGHFFEGEVDHFGSADKLVGKVEVFLQRD